VRKLSSRDLQGACFTCVFLSFTCKNKDHPSFSSVSLHSAVSGRFCIIFCMSDGLATYYIPLESSLQVIFESACFTCVFLSFTCKNKDYPSFSSVLLHSVVSGMHCIIFSCLMVWQHIIYCWKALFKRSLRVHALLVYF